jgi:LmbE family N-acetylglucosaminyl deacetylase
MHEELGTILGVFGHPDDETYLMAGLMAHAAASGNRVVCVTATRGEGGSWDEKRWPSETMGEVRAKELEEGLGLLGVKEHHWLGYIDATCADVPLSEGVAKVQPFIEDIQPDTVFSFGPDGMTDHADHKAVCAWTTEAFGRAAKPGAKLYYATTTKEWADEFVPRMNKFNVFAPGFPPVTSPDEPGAIQFDLSPELLELKLQAIGKHVSQVYYMLKFFGEDFFREAHRSEYFRLAEQKATAS